MFRPKADKSADECRGPQVGDMNVLMGVFWVRCLQGRRSGQAYRARLCRELTCVVEQ